MTDGTVADGNGAGFGQSDGRISYNHGADKHHGAVRQLITGGLHVRAIRLDLHTHNYATAGALLVCTGYNLCASHLGVLHQHILTRDPNVVQLQESVIHLVEAEFGANVTYNHACTHGGLNKSLLLHMPCIE